MTLLSLNGDDAPLNCKPRYLLWAFPAAFQTRVNANPSRRNVATDNAANNATFGSLDGWVAEHWSGSNIHQVA